MRDQSELSILDWLRENLKARRLKSLFSRPRKVEKQDAGNVRIRAENVEPETQGQLSSAAATLNIVSVNEVNDTFVSENEGKAAKIAHVIITADIPEGMTLNVTIQTSADGEASVSHGAIPIPRAGADRPLVLPKFKFPQMGPALSSYFDRLNKLGKQREWFLAVGALLVYLFAVTFQYVLDFNFSQPRSLRGIFGQFAMMDYQITVDLFPPNSENSVRYTFTGEKITNDVELEMQFENAPALVKRVYIEILQLNPGELVHIHIRQIKFLP